MKCGSGGMGKKRKVTVESTLVFAREEEAIVENGDMEESGSG